MILKNDGSPESDETFIYELSFGSSIETDGVANIDAFLAKRGIAKTGHTVVVRGQTLTNQRFKIREISGSNYVVMHVEYTIPANDLIALRLVLGDSGEVSALGAPASAGEPIQVAEDDEHIVAYISTSAAGLINGGKVGPVTLSYPVGGATVADVVASGPAAISVDSSGGFLAVSSTNKVAVINDRIVENDERFAYRVQLGGAVSDKTGTNDEIIAKHLASIGLAATGHAVFYTTTGSVAGVVTLAV